MGFLVTIEAGVNGGHTACWRSPPVQGRSLVMAGDFVAISSVERRVLSLAEAWPPAHA